MNGSDDQLEGRKQPTTADNTTVAVLGCGNMGSAIVRSLLASGRRVVAWNRTTARAEALADEGAVVAERPQQAVADASIVFVCLGSTADVPEVLGMLEPDERAGLTVLNVTSGTVGDGRHLGDWAATHGVNYLDAAILAYPEQLGTESARFVVAGDKALWHAHEDVIRSVAQSSLYVGDNYDAANVIDAGLVGAFYISSLVSFVEATRFMSKFDVPYDTLEALVEDSIGTLESELKQILRRIATGEFATDQATIDVYAHAAAAFAAGMGSASEAALLHATADVLGQAVEAGLGSDDIAAVFTLSASQG